MLEKLKDLPPGIDGLRAVGKLSKEDYDEVMEPLLAGARREGRRVRFLYELGSDFTGLTGGPRTPNRRALRPGRGEGVRVRRARRGGGVGERGSPALRGGMTPSRQATRTRRPGRLGSQPRLPCL
jgi:hypothetical protein